MEVPCIKCGQSGAVRLDLADGDTITCGDCDEEFTTADVREVLDTWTRLLKWLDTHPARVEEREAITAR